jgi:hypothetical protein
LLAVPPPEHEATVLFGVPSYVAVNGVADAVGAVRVSVPTFKRPVVAAKKLLSVRVAVELVDPQVVFSVPNVPRVSVPTFRSWPAATLALDELEEIVKLFVTDEPDGIVLSADPL